MSMPEATIKLKKGQYLEAKAHGKPVEVWASPESKRDVVRTTVTSCAGESFTKKFSRVPDGFEAEAEHNPFLEVRVAGKAKAKAPKKKTAAKASKK